MHTWIEVAAHELDLSLKHKPALEEKYHQQCHTVYRVRMEKARIQQCRRTSQTAGRWGRCSRQSTAGMHPTGMRTGIIECGKKRIQMKPSKSHQETPCPENGQNQLDNQEIVLHRATDIHVNVIQAKNESKPGKRRPNATA